LGARPEVAGRRRHRVSGALGKGRHRGRTHGTRAVALGRGGIGVSRGSSPRAPLNAMTVTVGSLLRQAELRTISLTPGVGEDREITWAHVCELPEPWRWLGPGALVMSTGIGIPTTTDEQCDYIA